MVKFSKVESNENIFLSKKSWFHLSFKQFKHLSTIVLKTIVHVGREVATLIGRVLAALRALLSLRGLRGAPEVPSLCRETSVSRTVNAGTVGKNGLRPLRIRILSRGMEGGVGMGN